MEGYGKKKQKEPKKTKKGLIDKRSLVKHTA